MGLAVEIIACSTFFPALSFATCPSTPECIVYAGAYIRDPDSYGAANVVEYNSVNSCGEPVTDGVWLGTTDDYAPAYISGYHWHNNQWESFYTMMGGRVTYQHFPEIVHNIRNAGYEVIEGQGTTPATLYPNGCSDLCSVRMDQAAASCISGQLEWYDCETDDFGCVVKTCSDYELECSQTYEFYAFTCNTDAQGNVTSTTCAHDACVEDAHNWAVTNCHDPKYLDQYDCASATGVCIPHDCSDLFADCVDECGGDVEYFSCLTQDGVTDVSSPCVCENEYVVTPDQQIVDNSNTDGQAPEIGDTDLDFLSKITNNTNANNQNLANLAGINHVGFNNLDKVLLINRCIENILLS